MLETKNLNIVITEEADSKLQKVMDEKRFKNRADAVDWIIAETFRIVFPKAAERGVGAVEEIVLSLREKELLKSIELRERCLI